MGRTTATASLITRVLSIVAGVLILCMAPLAVMAEDGDTMSGTANPSGNVKWTLTSDGVLTFSVEDPDAPEEECAIIQVLDSEGRNLGYKNNAQYAKDFRNNVKKIVINEGVTGIGWKYIYKENDGEPGYSAEDGYTVDQTKTGVFQEYPSLTEVSTCSTIKRIGWSAFRKCSNLSSFDFSSMENLEEIMNQAFSPSGLSGTLDMSSCTGLKTLGHSALNEIQAEKIILPSGIETIGSNALGKNVKLEEISFTNISSVKKIYKEAFKESKKLQTITDEESKQKAKTVNAVKRLFKTDVPANALNNTAFDRNDWNLKITIKSTELIYNGNEQEGYKAENVSEGDNETCTVTGLKEGHTIVSISGYNPAKGTDAADSPYSGSFAELSSIEKAIDGSDGYHYQVNYVFTEAKPGQLTIKKLPNLTVNITGNNDSCTYDGKDHTVNGYEFEATEPEGIVYKLSDFSFNGEAEASRRDAGTTNMNLKPEMFLNNNPNIESVTFSVTDGYQTIDPADVTVRVTGKQSSDDYDGAEHVAGGYSIKLEPPEGTSYPDTLKYGDEDIAFTGTAEAKRTNVAEGEDTDGQTDMGLKPEQFSNKSQNFGTVIFKVTDGYQKINPVDVTITVKDQTHIYNGEKQGEKNAAYTNGSITSKAAIEGLKGSDRLTKVILDGSETYAREYNERIAASGAEIGENGVLNGNYNIKYSAGKLTIIEADITYTVAASDEAMGTVSRASEKIGKAAASGDGSEQSAKPALGSAAEPKTGYKFISWTDNNDNDKVVSTETEFVPQSLPGDYTAHFAPVKYKVNFDINGGDDGTMADQDFEYDETKELTENAFSRDGYIFTGWNTAADGTGTGYSDKASVKNLTAEDGGTVTLYAQWTANDSKVVYNANGGEGTTADTTGKTDDTVKIAANGFSREGYSFDSWNTAADGSGTKYTPDDDFKLRPTVTELYAQWTPNKYKVTFVDEDGTTVLKEAAEYDYGTSAGDITKPADPSKASTAQYTYKFAGWSPEIKDVTGYATYKATYTQTVNKYKVTFVDEDGTTVLKDAAEYDYGTAAGDIAKPADPSKASTAQYTYKFAGWSPEVKDVTGDATYKAAYTQTVNKYKVTFVDADGKILKEVEYEYGTQPEDIDAPAPEKPADAEYTYTFSGWNREIDEVTGEATYIAGYSQKPNEYTVTYKYSGDVPDNAPALPTAQTAAYGSTVVTSGAPQLSGYTFSGWSRTGSFVMPANDVEITGSWTENTPEPTPTPDPDPEPTPTPTPDPDPSPSPRPASNPGPNRAPAPNNGAVTAVTPVEETIPDEPAPTAEPEQTPEPEVIPDEPTPMAGTWALLNLIMAAATAIGAVVALFRRKDEDDDETDDEEDDRSRKMAIAKIVGLLAGIAAVVVFILTEDMNNLMAFVDRYTPLMAFLLGVQIVAAILNKKASEAPDSSDEE